MGIFGRLTRRTGLFILRELIKELQGIRYELAHLRITLETQQRQPAAIVQVGQGFRTGRASEEYAGEPGGVDSTSDEKYLQYTQIASHLYSKLGRLATTEEIEREYLLRYES